MVGESHQADASITMEITENDHQRQYEESNGEALRELLRPPLDVSSFHKPRPIPQSGHAEPRDVKRVSFIWAYLFVGIVLAFGLWTCNIKKGVRAQRIRRRRLLEP